MVPTKSTPKPLLSNSDSNSNIHLHNHNRPLTPTQTHQPPPSNNLQSLFPLLPPLMTAPNPYPLSPQLQPQPQPHPNSPLPSLSPPLNSNFDFPQCPITDSAFDHRRKTRDDGNGTCMLAPDGNVEREIAAVPHQQMGFEVVSLGTGIGVSDQDIDIDNIIAHFFNDPVTNTCFNGNGSGHLGSASFDLNGSECKGDERAEGGFLKRGIDLAIPHDDTFHNFGSAFSMDDNPSAKRSRKTGKQENGKEELGNDDIGAVELGFEYERHTLPDSARHIHGSQIVGSISPEEGDQRGKRKVDDNGSVGHRRFSREEKRKEPLIDGDFLSSVIHEAELGLESKTNNSGNNRNLDINHRSTDNVAQQQLRNTNPREYGSRKNEFMERFRDIAKENASRFAHFVPDVEEDRSSPAPEVLNAIDDCPAPFSTAMKSIKDRGMKSMQIDASITWVSKKNQEHIGARPSVPSLQELCLKILANNADAIVSLDSVPDDLRHRLSQLLCDSRKMNSHFFELLISGSPTEIRLRDCSWLTEEQFTKSFQTCDTANLVVLQLDQCGRCMTDYALLATLAQSPRRLPRLTSLSLSGACRLSDGGLHALISSAPVLRSINLSQCSLLTSTSLCILADSLGSLLKELYLDDCQNINAALIVPALKELQHLEVLSLAGIQTVCDEFIKDYIIARGHKMKELVLKDCIKLTDASVKVIAEHCPGLCVLDLMNLCKLTDLSIGYVANSCRALHTLKLCRNPFSDEAIAAFMETTGESLKELSLNNIKKVGHHTTLSLASHAKNLHTLDLSWCRNLTDNELGLIVDGCFSLRLLKLFGCTQVTDVFLNGHSNPDIQIIGLKMSPLLQHVKMPDPHEGALRYSSVSVNLI